MIVSNKWLKAAYGQPLRKFLATNVTIHQLVDFAGLPVFPQATVRTIVIISTQKEPLEQPIWYLPPISLQEFRTVHDSNRIAELMLTRGTVLSRDGLKEEGWSLSGTALSGVLERLRIRSVALSDYLTTGKTYFGVKTGLNEAFIVDRATRDRLILEDPASAEILRPIVGGRDVRRYTVSAKEKYLIWTYLGVPIRKYPAILGHLRQYQQKLEKRWDKGNHWWELRACDYYDKFSSPKIIFPDIATSCRFSLDAEGLFGTNTTYFIAQPDLFLLGLLNSKAGQFYFSLVCAGLEGGGTVYLRFFGQYMDGFPVPAIDFNDPADAARHAKMVELVEGMLDLHRRLAAASIPADRKLIERQIEATDHAIDALVYELYGLTEEEIGIVEGRG